jgi:hypothetical protein
MTYLSFEFAQDEHYEKPFHRSQQLNKNKILEHRNSVDYGHEDESL